MSLNRYRDSILVRDDTGDWISPVTPFIDTRERKDDLLHQVKQGERLDTIAARYLGDAKLWWVVAEYNNILWFQNIEAGDVLRLPSYETVYLELMRR